MAPDVFEHVEQRGRRRRLVAVHLRPEQDGHRPAAGADGVIERPSSESPIFSWENSSGSSRRQRVEALDDLCVIEERRQRRRHVLSLPGAREVGGSDRRPGRSLAGDGDGEEGGDREDSPAVSTCVRSCATLSRMAFDVSDTAGARASGVTPGTTMNRLSNSLSAIETGVVTPSPSQHVDGSVRVADDEHGALGGLQPCEQGRRSAGLDDRRASTLRRCRRRRRLLRALVPGRVRIAVSFSSFSIAASAFARALPRRRQLWVGGPCRPTPESVLFGVADDEESSACARCVAAK